MPKSNKWDKEAEQALLFAIILGRDDGEKPRYNWPAVHAFMDRCNMDFSKDAISQHFTKFMLKDFKAKYPDATATATTYGDASTAQVVSPSTPKKATRAKAAAANGTPASRKRGKKAIKTEEASGDEGDGAVAKNGLPLATPTKKAKTKANKEQSDIKVEVNTEEGSDVAEDTTMREA